MCADVDLCRPIHILSWLWWPGTVCGQPPDANHILLIACIPSLQNKNCISFFIPKSQLLIYCISSYFKQKIADKFHFSSSLTDFKFWFWAAKQICPRPMVKYVFGSGWVSICWVGWVSIWARGGRRLNLSTYIHSSSRLHTEGGKNIHMVVENFIPDYLVGDSVFHRNLMNIPKCWLFNRYWWW